MGKLEKLEKLQKLKESGTITEQEFNTEKEKLMSNKNINNKRVKVIIAVIIILVLIICGAFAVYYFTNNKSAETSSNSNNTTETKGEVGASVSKKEDNSSPSNDLDLGLKSVKIDNVEEELTEQQKVVLQYFDNDYIDANNYEFLMRYPQIYEGSQIKFHGEVVKIISSSDTDYKLVVWVGDSEKYYQYWKNYRDGISTPYSEYVENNISDYVVIEGKQTETRLIEGDWITIYGRYKSIDNYTIDEVSFTIPTINVYSVMHDTDLNVEGGSPDGIPDKFDFNFIRKVAKAIFNDSVTVRDATEDEALITSSSFMNNPAYVCELDNQSNAKFSKYFFSCDEGKITDVNNYSPYPFEGNETGITRNIEFAPDFEHFFLFIYDTNHKILTLEYYDKDFNKIWSREFEETERTTYDFTENNIYLVANGYLYIINTSTGEDSFEKRYVGAKVNVRKLKDSLLLFEAGKTETVMKTDLQGNIKWTANVANETGAFEIQIKNNTLITTGWSGENNGLFYVVINLDTGNIELTAKAINNTNY